MRFHILSLLILPFVVSAGNDEQQILTNPTDMADSYHPLTGMKPTLSDLLTIETSASIFYSYARELELSERFGDPNAKNTILVPTNKAVMALARKPHEGTEPVEGGVIISEQEYDALSKKNVERWVSAHIIPESPISLSSSRSYDTMLKSKSVAFTTIDGKPDAPEWTRVVLDNNVHITAMKEALNGVLYVIDGTVKTD